MVDVIDKIRSERTLYPIKSAAEPFFLYDQANDDVVVLIHGLTGSPYDMRELANYLHERELNVMGVRVAGHGTDPADLVQTNYEDWMKSIEDTVACVESQHKRIFLVGYSFGGNLALEMVVRNPNKFSGIVCIGASVFLWMGPLTQWYLKNMNHALRAVGKQYWKKSYIPKDQRTTWESTGNYTMVPLKSMLDWKYFIDNHTTKELQRITVPVLFMHSRQDKISHPRSAQFLFDNVGSKFKELCILPEQNHNPLRSDSRDRIFRRVSRFIQNT